MDVNDIFWKLTRGVRFKNKPNFTHIGGNSASITPKLPAPANNISKKLVPGKTQETTDSSDDEDSISGDEVQLITDNSRQTEPQQPLTAGADQTSAGTPSPAEMLRKQHRLHVQGADVPAAVASFAAMGVRPQLLSNLRATGFHEPTPIQMQAVPVMLARRELLACAPTGSGKTAAYLLPLLQHLREPRNAGCRALVLVPSRELARQISLEAARLAAGTGLRVLCLDRARRNPDGSARAVSAKYDLLVSTPNRLIFLLDAEPALLSLRSVQWLVVDESDKLFEEGERGFRDQLGRVYTACDSTQLRRALFSATFEHDVDQWCRLNLDNVVTVSVGQKNTACDVIEQRLVFAGSEPGKMYAFRNMMQAGLTTPCLIFVQTKERAKELFRELIYEGIMVDVIHADRTRLQRDNVVKAFRSGKVWVLICTELMGRGIDFKGVNLVVNYDLPASIAAYIHRIGRTGRAGRPGKAVSFFTLKDVPHMRQIAQLVSNSGGEVPEYLLQVPRKSKKDRREMALHPLRRETIDTTPRYDRERMARVKALKRAEQRRQATAQGAPPPKRARIKDFQPPATKCRKKNSKEVVVSDNKPASSGDDAVKRKKVQGAGGATRRNKKPSGIKSTAVKKSAKSPTKTASGKGKTKKKAVVTGS